MSDNSDTGLICIENLPIRWSRVDESDVQIAVAASHLLNEERLRVINGLDEHRLEIAEEHSGISQELHKLDFKLNLILEMVGQLMSAATQPPVAAPVELTPSSITWHCVQEVDRGSWLKVELFLHARYPFPVVMYGEVKSVRKEGEGVQIELALQALSEQSLEQFEKYIFRCHRRHIARARQEAAASD